MGVGGASPIADVGAGFIISCCVTRLVSSMHRLSDAWAIWSIVSIIFIERDWGKTFILVFWITRGRICGMAANGDGWEGLVCWLEGDFALGVLFVGLARNLFLIGDTGFLTNKGMMNSGVWAL